MDKPAWYSGITTVFAHKKWVFAYVVLLVVRDLALAEAIGGSDVALILGSLLTFTLGASSFDKSVWRKDDKEED